MQNLRKALVSAGAVLEGEFFFALKKKGNVSCKYINMDPVFTKPDLVMEIGADLIEPWRTDMIALAAPAVGGIPLLYAAAQAHQLMTPVAWADKQADGTFSFERAGFAQALEGRRVLLLEDIVSTGGSGRAVADLVRAVGGELIAASFVWNRGRVTAEQVGVPTLYSLINESVDVYKAGEHPKWGQWPLVENIGHPDYYPDYPGPKIRL